MDLDLTAALKHAIVVHRGAYDLIDIATGGLTRRRVAEIAHQRVTDERDRWMSRFAAGATWEQVAADGGPDQVGYSEDRPIPVPLDAALDWTTPQPPFGRLLHRAHAPARIAPWFWAWAYDVGPIDISEREECNADVMLLDTAYCAATTDPAQGDLLLQAARVLDDGLTHRRGLHPWVAVILAGNPALPEDARARYAALTLPA